MCGRFASRTSGVNWGGRPRRVYPRNAGVLMQPSPDAMSYSPSILRLSFPASFLVESLSRVCASGCLVWPSRVACWKRRLPDLASPHVESTVNVTQARRLVSGSCIFVVLTAAQLFTLVHLLPAAGKKSTFVGPEAARRVFWHAGKAAGG